MVVKMLKRLHFCQRLSVLHNYFGIHKNRFQLKFLNRN